MRSRVGLGRLLFAAALLVSAIGFTAQTFTGALFNDTAPAGANTFATDSCFRADLSSVQKGTATSSANGTVTVSISSVVMSKSFLFFQTRHSSNRPVGSEVAGRIASSTSLEFLRVTDEASPGTITIQWYVMQFRCGVRVQRGVLTGIASPATVSIAPIQSTAQAFVTFSKTPSASDSTWDQNDAVAADITSPTTIEFRSDASIAAHTLWWEVVEYTNPADINVQRGTTSMTGTATTANVTLPAAVNTSRAFLLASFRTSGTGADIGARMLRGRLTTSATLAFDRGASGSPDDITEIAWQVIELKDGSQVQHGTASFASGTAQATASLNTITLSRAAAFSPVMSGGGLNMGSTPYVGDDIVGVSAVTAALTATQLTLDRSSTVAAADVGWTVVEWGRSWWNSSYAYRQRITVNAGSASAASGYAVALTFDHAGLVSTGKAKSNGDDVRVLWWSGTAWTQLDRVLEQSSSWNTSTTTLMFKTQETVAANDVIDNYYLYYGNSSATSPPSSKANVYLSFDDFTGATIGSTPSNWTVLAGGPWQAANDGGNTILRRLSSGGTTGRQYIYRNGISATNVFVQARLRMTPGSSEDLACVFMRAAGTGASDISGYRMCLQENNGLFHQRAKYVSGTFTNIEATSYSWTGGQWYTIAGAVYGTTLNEWVNGTLVGTNSDSSLSAAGTAGVFAFVGSQIDYDFDDVVIRPYVDPEPTTSLGPEQT